MFATGSENGWIQVWNTSSMIAKVHYLNSSISNIEYLKSGILIAATNDHKLFFWNLTTSYSIQIRNNYNKENVTRILAINDTHIFISYEFSIRLINILNYSDYQIWDFTDPITDIKLIQNKTLLLIAFDYALTIYDLSNFNTSDQINTL